jgi:hypothetical protein
MKFFDHTQWPPNVSIDDGLDANNDTLQSLWVCCGKCVDRLAQAGMAC